MDRNAIFCLRQLVVGAIGGKCIYCNATTTAQAMKIQHAMVTEKFSS